MLDLSNNSGFCKFSSQSLGHIEGRMHLFGVSGGGIVGYTEGGKIGGND
jgi:hypothetical protein